MTYNVKDRIIEQAIDAARHNVSYRKYKNYTLIDHVMEQGKVALSN
mgnify:CR=1 FL=1